MPLTPGAVPKEVGLKTRSEKLLEEARKAEEIAAKAGDPAVREHYLKIAQGYRHLARDLDRGS
jgi:hypothetical protein